MVTKNDAQQLKIVTTFYYRSQKTYQLQKGSGIFPAHHGLSRSGLGGGTTMGDSVDRRTIDNTRDKMSNSHKLTINQHIKKVHTIVNHE